MVCAGRRATAHQLCCGGVQVNLALMESVDLTRQPSTNLNLHPRRLVFPDSLDELVFDWWWWRKQKRQAQVTTTVLAVRSFRLHRARGSGGAPCRTVPRLRHFMGVPGLLWIVGFGEGGVASVVVC